MRPVMWLLIVACVVSGSPARAVEIVGAGIKGGALMALTNVQFEGEDRLDNDARYGAVAGAFVEIELKRRSAFHWVLEANYLQKGYKGRRNLQSDPEPIDVDVSATYLSIPVLGRVLFSEDDDLTVYAVFGPSLDLLLEHDDDALLDGFRGWGITGNVGIGFEILMADPLKLQLDFRFVTEFTDSYDGSVTEVSSVRQQGVVGTVGLRF